MVSTKRMKIAAAAEEELAGEIGRSNTGSDQEVAQQTNAAIGGDHSSSLAVSPAVLPINTTSPPLRVLSPPPSGNFEAWQNWPRNPRLKLPTLRKPKDSRTTDAVLSVGLPNKTILEGQFLFFSDHYGIALLEIDVDLPLQRPSIGSGPEYGQEVFVLARDMELSLKESDFPDRSYQMFLSCGVPMAGNGGPVIDHDGNVTGMAFYWSPITTVLSISTIMTCIEMWLKFSHIARPMHGLGVRTFAFLDVSLQEEISLDHGIDSGFIVDEVSYDSAAESLGILPGDVIVSFNDQHSLTLPQLEDYLLSLGWKFLNNSSSMVDIRLEVYDLVKQSKRSITLPVEFCDA
uniref:PDZ domain-containing protein n=1 Tax=Leersia perrieri TaxID=77586 RepID=A0A0D9XKP3_9ORYZ